VRHRVLLLVLAVLASLMAVVPIGAPPAGASTVPSGFQDTVALSGLNQPMMIRFAPDGRVFVGEKSGIIKVYDDLSDTTPTVFADLRVNVHNYWDRGLEGMALDPQFPTRPYVYVLYSFNAAVGGTAPRWPTIDGTSDDCADPQGNGCVISGRLSRLTASGDVMTGSEQVLINDWCQQFPSHSVGDLRFGSDGYLYASGGDGASFDYVDYGQSGSPKNPCGDPPTGVGGTQTAPTAEGGALRAQDVRTTSDPTQLNGSVIRIDPNTGAAVPTNPNASSTDANAQRIVAYGLRNPFRMTTRPGTGEIWIGDVGWNDWEEIDRLSSITSMTNYGWPCYEGTGRQPAYDAANLNLCETLYAQGASAVASPYYTYKHSDKVVTGDGCPTGSSSITGLAFYGGGNYPSSYNGTLFFADYSRNCIWAIPAGADGLPDSSKRFVFVSSAASPVDLESGPGGDLFYADLNGGTIHRVEYFSGNQPPHAAATATPSTGTAPLKVNFDASGSTDPENDALTYAWDLDGDGEFDDATGPTPVWTYTTAGVVNAQVRVTDAHGNTSTATVQVAVDNGPPVPSITSPTGSLTWKVGDVISFSGSATDGGSALPASSLSWTWIMHHCSDPNTCHTHTIQTFSGVASGQFTAPDHEYPSYLEVVLTATDSAGLTGTTSVNLYPKTAVLHLQTNPTGLQLAAGSGVATAPYDKTVFLGGTTSVAAPSPQVLNGVAYQFSGWSDNGLASHNVTLNADTTLTANFVPIPAYAKVNFQPKGAPAVAGYLIDGGAPYSARSSGFTYGWNVNVTSFAYDRNKSNSPDQRYDTLILMQKKSGLVRWEMAVPNGQYLVHVVSGDPSYINSHFQVVVEKQRAIDASPTAANKWVDGTIQVTVSDGRLSVTNGSGAVNNKICFLEIYKLS
jgi:glucose/arabinose dehydrogenase/PKD repeat protein